MKRILWWLRRDLRISDNLVLHEALHDGDAVIPVFVLDPRLMESKMLAPARRRFLLEALAELDANLRARGSYLVVRRGDPARELVKLGRETQADAVYFHTDYTPYARQRDERVRATLDKAGVKTASFNEIYLADPREVLKKDGTPYTVYTPYRKRFESVIGVPGRFHNRRALNTPPGITSLPLPTPGDKTTSAMSRGGSRQGKNWRGDS